MDNPIPSDANNSHEGVHQASEQQTIPENQPGSSHSHPQKRRKLDDHPQHPKGKKDKNRNRGRRRGSRPDDGQNKPSDDPVTTSDTTHAVADKNADKSARLPKRRCALLIGFCGSGYNGMQVQPDVRTIEGELFSALVKAGAVSKDNADDPVKVGLQRAARTDAGVHAAGNVVSIKMITDVPGVPDVLSRINDELPPEIRLWSFVRVQGSFNARLSCDSRKYTYFFPSYLLVPPKPTSGLLRTYIANSVTPSSPSFPPDSNTLVSSSSAFWESTPADSTRSNDLALKKQYRVGPEMLQRLRDAARKFEGTHNFHNFTVGRDVRDKSCHRFMKRIEIADPVVYGETEWISVMFHGQSFMLHQRKMMFILVLTSRTCTPPSIIDELYTPRSVSIPKMPSLGLLLEYPIFESYNARVAKANTGLKGTDTEFRPPIDFEVHAEKIEAFKDVWIYDRMRASEEKLEIFDRWIHSIDTYSGADLSYLNSRGAIPDAAVYRKGEKRTAAFRERRKFDVTAFPEEGPALSALKESLEKEEHEEASKVGPAAGEDVDGDDDANGEDWEEDVSAGVTREALAEMEG